VADVKTAARDLTQDAMETLKNAMLDQEAPWSAEITAAIAVLDRGWGKPTQAVDANLRSFDGRTDHDRQARLAVLEALQVDDRLVSNT
jgi:hypothetical protein